MKIGICITTYNAESAFSELWATIPKDRGYEIVTVNGGEMYSKMYDGCHWIQHTNNVGPAASRNDGMNYLYDKDCDILFCVEDDMLILKPDAFDVYADAIQKTKHQYLCYASFSHGSGKAGNRTPVAKISYINHDCSIYFYPNVTNEFSVRTRNMWQKLGNYDTEYYSMFDVDSVYKSTLLSEGPCFWYFPDIGNSDDYVSNNHKISSRIDAGGKRTAKIKDDMELFYKKHGLHIPKIPKMDLTQVFNKIKKYS